MPSIKNQRGSAGEKIVEIYLLKKGLTSFAPNADGNRDLIVELDDKFYGVQVKACSKGYKEYGRNFARYKFNFSLKGKPKYDVNKCQIFACVCLKTNLIQFIQNKGQKGISYRADSFTKESQKASFEQVIEAVKKNK